MISASVIAAAPTGVDTRTCSPHGARTADLDLTGRKRNRDAGSEERKADCSIYSRGRSDAIAWTNGSFRLLRHTPHTRNALRKGGYPSGNLGRYDVCSSALYSFFSPSAPHIGRYSEKARGPAIFPERERLLRGAGGLHIDRGVGAISGPFCLPRGRMVIPRSVFFLGALCSNVAPAK